MKKNPEFVKEGNTCPYCTYICESASMINSKERPKQGDLSFCLMCCQPLQWNENMDLVKFDLNSIDDIVERNRLKIMSLKMQEFWTFHPDKTGKREKYLKAYDEQTQS